MNRLVVSANSQLFAISGEAIAVLHNGLTELSLAPNHAIKKGYKSGILSLCAVHGGSNVIVQADGQRLVILLNEVATLKAVLMAVFETPNKTVFEHTESGGIEAVMVLRRRMHALFSGELSN